MKTFGSPTNFRSFKKMLQDEYGKRRSANESYSLRAFSKSLGIHSACLSAFLNGKRPFTSNMIRRVGTELGVGPEEIASYIRPSQKQTRAERISIDTFSKISQWYYDAILELCQVKGFSSDYKFRAFQEKAGGSWYDYLENSKELNLYLSPSDKGSNIGFRLVRVSEECPLCLF